MFNFEPNDYRNYTSLLEKIDNVDNIKNEIDSLNLSFVSEEGEDIDTKNRLRTSRHKPPSNVQITVWTVRLSISSYEYISLG